MVTGKLQHVVASSWRLSGGRDNCERQYATERDLTPFMVYKCLGSFDPIDKGERIRWKPIARCRVTGGVIEQKSADGIVAKCSP